MSLASALLRRFPAALLLTIVWGSLRMLGISIEIQSVPGIVFIFLSMGVMMFEFNRSRDIMQTSFNHDLVDAILAVIVATLITTHLVENGHSIGITDIIVLVTVLGDAVLGPINSFGTALRNWSAQSNQGGGPGGVL